MLNFFSSALSSPTIFFFSLSLSLLSSLLTRTWVFFLKGRLVEKIFRAWTALRRKFLSCLAKMVTTQTILWKTNMMDMNSMAMTPIMTQLRETCTGKHKRFCSRYISLINTIFHITYIFFSFTKA